ncbi:MAG: flagellar M-ring protein FliF [Alphaproteobacteria bacterium]|nr:flagellar M-ring protein FliF [Alphaproteobacteria bacterium]
MTSAIGQEQLSLLFSSLQQLGARRLGALGAVGLAVVLAVGIGTYYLSRPPMEVLYSGLESQDVGRISAALERAGVTFDVSAEGKSIFVAYGNTARARMLLAQQGLPSGASSGYELFDQLGSMGLTSFMQEVTRVRALEGEISRTVQSMEGIQAARVHLVLPDPGSFRRKQRPPSASVVVRLVGAPGAFHGTPAIRHLVAAAVPGMTLEQVSVLSTEGSVLAAAGDDSSAAPQNMLELEKSMSDQIEEAAGHTLAPFLGLGNYRVSVSIRLNTDKKQTSEQTFDPESRVERSVKVVREEGKTENRASNSAVGVEENIPVEEGDATTGDQSRRQEERREELTNYELNSRRVETESNGYRVEAMTMAVLVNRKRLIESLGGSPAEAEITQRLDELSKIVSAATGLKDERGDRIEVSAIDFLADGDGLQPIAGLSILDHLLRNIPTIINAFAVLAVIAVVLQFGLKPALQAIAQSPPPIALESADGSPQAAALPNGVQGEALTGDLARLRGPESSARMTPRVRLEKLVEIEEEQIVEVLKQWIRKGVAR